MFIPDPESEFFHRGSRIRIKEFEYFNPKNCFQVLGNMIRDPDLDLLPIPDPGSATMVISVFILNLICSVALGFSKSVFRFRSRFILYKIFQI